MYGFKDEDIASRTPKIVLWSADRVVCVRVVGVVDDAVSDRWRAMVADEVAAHGAPRFIAVDFSEADPQNSMAARYRSAAFAREQMKVIEYGVVCTGGSAGPTVVVRAVLRALGLANLDIMTDTAQFADAIASMRRGVRPAVSSRLAS